ncbi:MAG: hypothetical protein QM750_23175 [Rubrivivax sp.]
MAEVTANPEPFLGNMSASYQIAAGAGRDDLLEDALCFADCARNVFEFLTEKVGKDEAGVYFAGLYSLRMAVAALTAAISAKTVTEDEGADRV